MYRSHVFSLRRNRLYFFRQPADYGNLEAEIDKTAFRRRSVLSRQGCHGTLCAWSNHDYCGATFYAMVKNEDIESSNTY